jgi:hypothetical protein
LGNRVDARDVLDPDARTRDDFRGRILGHFKRTGPNAWDDYRFVSEDGGEVEVLPGLKVQLEKFGAQVRMRREGRVVRVEWVPDAGEAGELRQASPEDRRRIFIERYLEAFDEAGGRSMAGYIAGKLDG